MRIQHNIMAMNAYRNYNTNTSALSKNLEKLSSGYKINRAGDDAAGLAISEKMRAQITGLETAQKNAKDGISLVQTAEGALTEVHDMLNRMTELATQSANGTFDDTTDRAQLQKEVVALKDEINRIADSANFNGIQLLDGSLDASATVGGNGMDIDFSTITGKKKAVTHQKIQFDVDLNGLSGVATAASQTIQINVGGQSINLKAAATGTFNATANLSLTAATITATLDGITYRVQLTGGKLTFRMDTGAGRKYTNTAAANAALVAAEKAGKLNPAYEVKVTAGTAKVSSDVINSGTQVISIGRASAVAKEAQIEFDLTLDMLGDGTTIKIGSSTYKIDYNAETTNGTTIGVKDLLDKNGKLSESDVATIASRLTKSAENNNQFSVGHNGSKITLLSKTALTESSANTEAKLRDLVVINTPVKNGKDLTLQIGDTSDSFNQLKVSIQDVHTSSLGIEAIDISTQKGAKDAVSVIKDAINSVSNVRGTLGATQNRLDHTMNNLSVMTENIQDAESTIRDTDVADEMMAYTKNNILIQSAQAMLAQANQVPQGVLQLLQ